MTSVQPSSQPRPKTPTSSPIEKKTTIKLRKPIEFVANNPEAINIPGQTTYTAEAGEEATIGSLPKLQPPPSRGDPKQYYLYTLEKFHKVWKYVPDGSESRTGISIKYLEPQPAANESYLREGDSRFIARGGLARVKVDSANKVPQVDFGQGIKPLDRGTIVVVVGDPTSSSRAVSGTERVDFSKESGGAYYRVRKAKKVKAQELFVSTKTYGVDDFEVAA